jgi:hypothetical protein
MDLEYKTGYRNSGRKPGMINYKCVIYNNKEYVVGLIQHNGNDIKFVFDGEDFPKVENRPWHLSSGKYIASTFYLDGGIKLELYIHNLIMDRITFDGKGQKETVDHTNRNGLDNRKENLRIISQAQQIINQGKKKRNVILPQDCQIKPDEIPKHIWYVRANGLHGDRFAIEFKTEGICWKTTSSKKINIIQKLQDAKEKLKEFYKQFPHLNPEYEIDIFKELNESFHKITSLKQ